VLRTVLQGVLSVIVGFVVVVAGVLAFQSIGQPGLGLWTRSAPEKGGSQAAAPSVTDRFLPPLTAPEHPSGRWQAGDQGAGFVLPDRSARYLELLVDTLDADRATDPERVRRTLEALQRLDAPDPRIYRWLGELYHREKAYREAAVAFERAVELDPDNATDRFNLATIYLVQERFPQAIREFNRVIRLQPPFLDDAYAYLGYCLYAMGDEKQARKAWEVSLQLDPDNPIARRYSTIP